MVSKTANENENEYYESDNGSLYNIIGTSNFTDDDDDDDDDDDSSMRKDGSSSDENSDNNEKGFVIRKHSIAAAAAAVAVAVAVFFLLVTILMLVVYYPAGGSNDHNNSLIVGTSSSNNTRGLAGPAGIFDPDADHCFKINKEDTYCKKEDKYCWYKTYHLPYGAVGDWEETFSPNGPDSGCGMKCTQFAASNGSTFTCDGDDYGDNDPRCNSECIDHYNYTMTKMGKRTKPIWCQLWLWVPFG
jgi:hypothetical protein